VPSNSCRNPRDYFAIFDKAEVVSADGSSSEHFELINCKCVDTYVTVKKNQNQICWKFRKVRANMQGLRLTTETHGPCVTRGNRNQGCRWRSGDCKAIGRPRGCVLWCVWGECVAC
jgi:hypothetical protein